MCFGGVSILFRGRVPHVDSSLGPPVKGMQNGPTKKYLSSGFRMVCTQLKFDLPPTFLDITWAVPGLLQNAHPGLWSMLNCELVVFLCYLTFMVQPRYTTQLCSLQIC